MEKLDIEYVSHLERLRRVPCPYRLYPLRLKALEIVSGRSVLAEIEAAIVAPLDALLGSPYADQFRRDLQIYGLYEAIGYFHSYEFPVGAKPWVDDVCSFYDEIAGLYMENHRRIVSSDDSNVRMLLQALRNQGDTPHNMPGLRMPPLEAVSGISPPEAPAEDPGYERVLPVHEDLERFFGEGALDKPANLAAELTEQLTARFTFDGFPSIQLVFFEVAELLQQHGIDPFSGSGQYVIQSVIESMNSEMFGDFDRWSKCLRCAKEFIPEIDLASANADLLNGGWVCPDCAE